MKNVNDPRVVLSEGTFDNTGVGPGFADLIVIAAVRSISVGVMSESVCSKRIDPGGVPLVSGFRSCDGGVCPSPEA